MPEQTVTFTADAAPFLAALDELMSAAQTAELPLHVVDHLLANVQHPADLIRLQTDPMPTAGTGQVRVRFYPSDRLLRLGFALRTGDVDLGIVEQHEGTSNGEGGELGQPAILPQAAPSS